MDGGEEGGGIFGVAGRDAAPAFEVQKGVLDEMSQLVQSLVIRPLGYAVFVRRDNGVHLLRFRLLEDRIGVIALVGWKMLRRQPLDQL